MSSKKNNSFHSENIKEFNSKVFIQNTKLQSVYKPNSSIKYNTIQILNSLSKSLLQLELNSTCIMNFLFQNKRASYKIFN